jgi:signal transduction histidine kinase/CheY-like chemotaxis protein
VVVETSQSKPAGVSFASNALPVGTVLLTLLYLAHTILYLAGLQNPDGSTTPQWMAIVTGVSTLIFAALSVAVRRGERDKSTDDHLIGFCALIVLANVTVHFAIAGAIWYGYNFVFYMIAIGALVTSRPWFLVLLVLTPLVALLVAVQTLDSIPWDLFAAIVLIGSALSALLHATRSSAINKLTALHARAEKSKREAEEALESSRTNAERLQRAQEDLQDILDKSPEVILIHRDGRIIYVNPALLDCLRLPASRAVGSSVESLLADEQSLPQGPARSTFQRSDGEGVILQLAAPVEVQFEGHSATLVTGRDITAQDADLQARLLLADRMAAIGVLSAGVAHEINNPLSYVLGNLETLNQTLDEVGDELKSSNKTEMRELIEDCVHGSRRVAEIVRTLNVMARPQDSVDTADLKAAVESASKMAANHLHHKSVELLVDVPSELPEVRGNPAKLSQVFLNILINAAQACDRSKEGNQVRVRARNSESSVVVEVADTGCGMSKEAQRRLFDPFFTTKPMGEGTGLGLYFCHNELTRCGGSIHFESEVGVGSRFEITLLHSKSAVVEARPQKPKKPNLGSALIIDDEALVAKALKRMIKSDKVQIARSGVEALALLERDDFEYVFCDLMMPEMSGPEFYSRALKIKPALEDNVVFITGGAFTDTSTAFVNEHQERILYKPFDLNALSQLLEELRAKRVRTDVPGR